MLVFLVLMIKLNNLARGRDYGDLRLVVNAELIMQKTRSYVVSS